MSALSHFVDYSPATPINAAWLNGIDVAVNGPLNAVLTCGADPTGMTDSTAALNDFFNAMTDNSNPVLPAGTYLYTPDLALGTGVGYLNMVGLTNVNLMAYGAKIINSFQVTTAPATQGTLYGVHLLSCTDCKIWGLTFDGNRDPTFGTNSDGNEFYSGFYMTGSTRCYLIWCSGINCQGDGASFNRISGNTGFNNDCGIWGGYYGSNRRNEVSEGGDYGWFMDGGAVLFGSDDAHRTSPKAGLDLEWEHATIGPANNDQRIFVGNVSCSGTMAGGGLYIARGAGITVGAGFRTIGLLGSSINIDNTATGSYETQNILIGACQLNSVYGIGITGGANISIKGTYIKATYPITVNSPLSAAPYNWVADIDGCTLVGESGYAASILAGRCKFTNNMCINASSGGGDNFMALFVPTCYVKGNTFTRDANQSAPGYGLIFGSSGSIAGDNNITSFGVVTHPISYGQDSVPAYPPMQNNFYNGAALPDTVATQQIACPIVDASVSTPQVLFTPFGNRQEIINLLLTVVENGTNILSTTTLDLGTAASSGVYLTAYSVIDWDLGTVREIAGDLAAGGVTTFAAPIFATFTPGSNNPKIQFMAVTRYDRSSLFTSPTLFG